MFLGTYEYTIDPKGRLFIPAKLREQNGATQNNFVITRGLEQCLYLYDKKSFHEVLSTRLTNLPVKNQQDARAFKRLLLAGAHDVSLDDNGRLLIAKPLLEYAGFKKDISILGVGERIELWSLQRWESYSRQAASTFKRMGKELEI